MIVTLALAIACASVPGRVEAGPTLVRMQLNFPLPVQDVGSDRSGLGGGVSVTHMNTPFVGVGADLLAHDWPASAGYRESFDRYLRSTRFETIRGTQWGFTALQMTAHVRFALHETRRLAPWLQIGAGAYRLDLNLNEVKTADTYAWVEGGERNDFWVVAGGYGEAGADLHVSSRVMVGLDATFHYVFSRRESLFWDDPAPDFRALTLGTHFTYGWK